MKSESEEDSPPYRADVDGLRAIAVLAVIGYHAFPGKVPGGFTGVDVFFVISGYLISSDVARRMQAGHFTLADFYARRIRRLFPSLLTVLACTAAFGFLVLLTDEQKLLLAHTASSAAFLENWRLLQEAGYFDSGAATKPLLHIWSLAIEEQFYLVFPLLFMAVRAARLRLAAVALLGAASFAFNLWLVQVDPSAAYFRPDARIWEILLGVALTFAWPLRTEGSAATWRADALAGSGLALLVCGIATIDRERGFPGAWALLPTVGTALLIAAGPGSWIARRLLAHRVVRFIGLLSYPLYLWHWPVLVFIRILAPSPSTGLKVAGLLASFALAVLTYYLVERRLRGQPPRAVALRLGGAMVVLAASAWIASLPDVPLPRAPGVPASEVGRRRDLNFDLHMPSFPACAESTIASAPCLRSDGGVPSAALIGDSHAYALFYGIAPTDKTRRWLVIANSSCPPLLGVHVIVSRRDCLPQSEAAVRRAAADPALHTVVLAFVSSYAEAHGDEASPRGAPLFSESITLRDDTAPAAAPRDVLARGLERTIDALERAGKRVVVYLDVPELPFSPRDCVDRPFAHRHVAVCAVRRADVLALQQPLRDALVGLQQRHAGLRVFDPLPSLCDDTLCQIERGDLLIYRDRHHLSLRGSALLAVPFLTWLDAGTR